MTSNVITKGPGVRCPHCESATELRTSRAVDRLIRDIYYRCRNDECGHVFVAQLVVKHTIVPSARPNPSIILPTYVPPQAKPKPANDDTIPPIPANDDDGDTAAEGTIVIVPS